MGEQSLWSEFLDERVENIATAILSIGVDGLMAEFENWLHAKDVINYEQVRRNRRAKDVPDNQEPS